MKAPQYVTAFAQNHASVYFAKGPVALAMAA
jgi:hypothetical protein